MVDKSSIKIYSTGKEETVDCEFSLQVKGTTNCLSFKAENLQFDICLKDIVDTEDFANLLSGKEKKIILHATLKLDKKEYQGLRKFLLKDDSLAVSLGGMRLEFADVTKKLILDTVKALKAKMG